MSGPERENIVDMIENEDFQDEFNGKRCTMDCILEKEP